LLLYHHLLFHLVSFCWHFVECCDRLNWLFVIVLVGVDVRCISLIGISCLLSSFLAINIIRLFIVVVCCIIICLIVSLVLALSFASEFTTLPSVSTIQDTFVIMVFAESSDDRLDITVLSSPWFVVDVLLVMLAIVALFHWYLYSCVYCFLLCFLVLLVVVLRYLAFLVTPIFSNKTHALNT
jgi:hypothetical protein